MKKGKSLLAVLCLGTLVFAAETFRNEEAGLSIWLPDEWTVNTELESSVIADAPDKGVFVELAVLEGFETLAAGKAALPDEIRQLAEDYKALGPGADAQRNGLQFFFLEGRGTVEGVKSHISAALIATPKKKVCLLTVGCPLPLIAKYEGDFQKIVQSLKAI
jgi:hypothetical protein